MWISNTVFKDIKIFWTVNSRPFIRHQGKDLDLLWIWCCFYFFLQCLVQVSHLLCHIIFIIRIRLWIFKQSTCTLYASEILLFKVFIKACKLARKILVDWSFLISVWNSVFIFSICNRLNLILIINTISLSLAKI